VEKGKKRIDKTGIMKTGISIISWFTVGQIKIK
jgi:hypothetical protein